MKYITKDTYVHYSNRGQHGKNDSFHSRPSGGWNTSINTSLYLALCMGHKVKWWHSITTLNDGRTCAPHFCTFYKQPIWNSEVFSAWAKSWKATINFFVPIQDSLDAFGLPVNKRAQIHTSQPYLWPQWWNWRGFCHARRCRAPFVPVQEVIQPV